MRTEASLRLEPASLNPPAGLAALLEDLASGEHGFGGTPVREGTMTLAEYLQRCCDMCDPAKVPPDLVPQTVFWVIDSQQQAGGMVRMRHYLNDRLRDQGGHIGYYIRRDKRGRGYATAALRQVLLELGKLGQKRALLTVHLDNSASIRVIEANGGQLESIGVDETGKQFGRYWITLTSG